MNGNGSDQRFNNELGEESSGQVQVVDQNQVTLSSVHPNGLWEIVPDQLPQQS